MRNRRYWFCAVVLFGGVLLASPALAWITGECIEDARQDLKECVIQCQEAFRIERDVCRNIDHACAEGCRATYQSCVEEPFGHLAACKGGCDAALVQAKANCRIAYKFGTPERDECIDQAQLVAFSCRDQCREEVQAPLVECWNLFRTCIKGCSKSPTPPPN